MLGPLTLTFAVALPMLPAANALVRKNDVVCYLFFLNDSEQKY